MSIAGVGGAQLKSGEPRSLKRRSAVTWATAWTRAANKATITATTAQGLCLSRHEAVGTEDRRARGKQRMDFYQKREDTRRRACPTDLAQPAPGELGHG